VTKKAGDYDPTTHTVPYTITVYGTGGVKDLTLTDTITTTNGTILTDTMTACIGDVQQKKPVCTSRDDGSYLISGLPDLERGQVLTLSYSVHISDDAAAYTQAKGNVQLNNKVTGNGTSPQGKSISDTAMAAKNVSITNLAKNGNRTQLKVGSTSIPVIQWTITVGDGSFDVGGLQLKDLLGDYLTLYQDKPIAIEAVKRSGEVSTINMQWNSSSVTLEDSGTSFWITLPGSDSTDPYTLFRVNYYTTYETPDSFSTYYNTVQTTLHNNPIGVTGTCSVAPPGNVTITKTGVRNGDYLDWTIVAKLPSGLYGTRGVYLTEYCDGVVLLENGCLSYKSADLTKAEYDVSVETESGETIVFTPYANNGITENTYSIVWGNQYSNVAEGKYNNTRGILFNCTGQNTWDSTWLIDEVATITVHMRVPITNGVSGGYTAQGILDGGGFISNIATCFVAAANKGSSTARINGVPLHKSGEQSGESSVIDYAVTLRNNDHVTGGAIMDAAKTQSMVFTDTYDQRLEYVKDSLKLELKTYETSSSPGNIVATFWYQGSETSDGVLRVTADQFVNTSGQTLKDYAASRKGTWYNFFFTYQLRVKNKYKDLVTASLEFDNTATLRWGTGSTESLTASTAVTYRTGLLSKQVLDAPDNGETLGNGNVLTYQIELNPDARDLDPNSDVLTVLDTLPNCLSVLWDHGTQTNVIGEYWDTETDSWVAFADTGSMTWQKSYYYDKTLEQNVLKFQVPDKCRVRITYQCQVTEYGEAVEIVNQVTIQGQATVQDSVESMFRVNMKSGTAASGEQQFAIIKTDSDTHAPMKNVQFVLYSAVQRNRTPTWDVPTQITGEDGLTYYYYGEYTTNESGYCLISLNSSNEKYILREYEAPLGYEKMADKYIQYSADPLESGAVAVGFENVFKNQTLSIVNEPIILPETGGFGTWSIYLAAALLILLAECLLLRRRCREL
jgi:hypothetical protein